MALLGGSLLGSHEITVGCQLGLQLSQDSTSCEGSPSMLVHMAVGRPQFLFGLPQIRLVTIWQVCSSRLSDLREREREPAPQTGQILEMMYPYFCYVLWVTHQFWYIVGQHEDQEIRIIEAILETSYHSGSITVYIFCNNLRLWRNKLIRQHVNGNYA